LEKSKQKPLAKKVKKNRNNLFVFCLRFSPIVFFSTKTITLHVKVSEKVTTLKKKGKAKISAKSLKMNSLHRRSSRIPEMFISGMFDRLN